MSEAMSSKKILVVDDEPIVLKFLQRLLLRDKHDVEVIDSGESALKKVGDHRYDIVLCDIQMPGWDGFETAAKLAEADPKLKIVLMSGYGHIHDRGRETAQPKVAGWIKKPFDVKELQKLINSL